MESPAPGKQTSAGGKVSSHPCYSVVIPSLGTRDCLADVVQAARAQTVPPWEIIVALPPSTDPPLPPGVRVARASSASSSAQRNAGVRAARAPIVFFFDDDMVPYADYAAQVLRVWAHADDRVVGVVGSLANPFHEGERLRRLLRAIGWQSHTAYFGSATRIMASGSIAHVPRPRKDVEVGFASTSCGSFPRELLCGELFSEEFDGYVMGEDLDLSARLSRRGTLIQAANALVVHRHGRSTAGDRTAQTYHEAMPLGVYQWRHKANGLRGRVAWEWSHASRLLFLLALGLAGRDFTRYVAYRNGLRAARRYLGLRHLERSRLAGQRRTGT